MDGGAPWIGGPETPGHSIQRPATSPGDITARAQSGDQYSSPSSKITHTSPELTHPNNGSFSSGCLGLARGQASAQTDPLLKLTSNTKRQTLTLNEHTAIAPEVGSSMSMALHSNPHSLASTSSSPRSVCGVQVPVFRHGPGSVTSSPGFTTSGLSSTNSSLAHEAQGHSSIVGEDHMKPRMMGTGFGSVHGVPNLLGQSFEGHMTGNIGERNCTPSAAHRGPGHHITGDNTGSGRVPSDSGRPEVHMTGDIIGPASTPSLSTASSAMVTRPARPACTFFHTASPLATATSSSLSSSARRGNYHFSYSPGSEVSFRPSQQFRTHHQASSSSPATCGTLSSSETSSTIISSPRGRSSTLSSVPSPSPSRSSSTVTMEFSGEVYTPKRMSTPGRTVDKGKGKEKATDSSTPSAPGPSPSSAAPGPSTDTGPHGTTHSGWSSSSDGSCRQYLPGGIFTPSPHRLARHLGYRQGDAGPSTAPSFAGPVALSLAGHSATLLAAHSATLLAGPAVPSLTGPFAEQFVTPVAPPGAAPISAGSAAASAGASAVTAAFPEGSSVDERYAPLFSGEQGHIDASMRPAEHEAASWITNRAFKILAETVPAQYQGNPDFAWAISEVVRLAEERAAVKYGLPDYQSAVFKQHNVDFGGNLPPFRGYLLRRDNGQYTRLIPADTLPPLKGIPATQSNKVGYWVLPPPNAASESGWDYQQQVEIVDPRPSSHVGAHEEDLQFAANYFRYPLLGPQSRIDTIIATTAATAASPSPSALPSSIGRPKRIKIYCDKWIHDGTCAFTQQGCKYKHEMPHDRATQHALGLFHGYPAWWKRQQAELARQKLPPAGGAGSDTASPPSSGRRAAVGSPSWRSGSVPERALQTSTSSFGPIGPPHTTPARRRLEAVKEGVEEEEEEEGEA